MMLSKNAVGNLINRYKAVLGKCRLINTFGSLALAAALALGSAGPAMAADWDGGNLTVGTGGDQTSLTVDSDAVVLTGTLTITDGGTVTVNSPGSISAGDGATPSNGKLLVTGGTLNVNGYSDSRDLQITGGTVNINGTTGNGWRENGLGGYAETVDESDATASTGLPTLVSGPNTVINITSANLFGGAATDFATAQLNIADGATINLMGQSPDESHTKDFDDAGMLFAGKGAATLDKDSANLLITGDSTGINVAQGNHGVFNAGVTHITEGATVDVQGGLLLTGYLGNTASQTVTDAMPSAEAGYTRVADGGSVIVGDKGHLFLNKGMTLDVAADGVLDNGGKVNLYADSMLAYSAGGDHKLTGIVANAGTLSVTDARLDLTGAQLDAFSGTAGTIAVERVLNTDSDTMARADMTDAQLAAWLEKDGSVTVQGNAARHARLHLGENATVDAASIAGGSAAVTGKVALLGNGSIQAQNLTLTGDALDIDSTGAQGNRIKANSLVLTPDTPDTDFTLASGKLFLKGETGSALSFAGSEGKGLKIADKGVLKLGEDANPGGDINANVTSEGVVDVAQGKWTLAAGKTLDIQDGSLTVGGGHDGRSAELNIQGDLKSSAEGDVGHDNGVNVMNNGVLSGDAEKFVTYTDDAATIATGLEKIHVANGGTLRLDGLESVNTQQMQNTKAGLLTAGSSGLISYGAAAIEISETDKGTSDGSIKGSAAEATSAVLAGINAEYDGTGDAITVGGGFGADALVVTGNTGDVAAAINGNTTLLGNGGQLITAEGDAATNVSIAAGKNLNLGSTGVTSNGGTLNGNVELAGAGSALNAAAANYTVGDITAAAADTGNVNVSAGGGLTAGAIGTATDAVSSVSADMGALAATSIDAGTVTADNGGTILSTGAITAGAGGVNVKNGSTVASVETLNTSTVLVTDGSIAAKTLTASADVTVANGKLLATGTDADASNVTGNLTLTDSEAALGDMAVTGNAVINGGSLVAQSLTLGGAATVTGGSLVAESLAVAGDAAFIDGAQVKADKLTGASGKTISVGDADDTKGGTTLTVGSLDLAGGNLYVDPAWGLASSNVAVGSFTGATATDVEINGNVGVGMNSMAAIGTTDTGWLAGQVSEATNGVGLTQNGVDSALGIYSAQVLDGAHGIIVDGTQTTADFTGAGAPTANQLDFSGKSLLVVTAAAAVTPDGAISSNTAGGTANIGDGAKLRITDAKVGQDYTVLGTNIDTITLGTDGTGWTGSNFITDSRMINGSFDAATGVLSTGLNSAANVYPKLDGDLVKVLDNAYTADQVGPAHVDSDVKGVRFLSRATSDNFIGSDTNLAAKTIESAARIAVAGAVPQMTMAANNAAGAAITQRTSIAQPDGNGMQSVSLNKAEGSAKNGMALWIMPLYQSQNAWNMEAGNSYDLKWHGGLGGVALGGDYTFDNALRAGIAFNIGGGYAEGEGDLAKTTNSFSFWGLGAYAGWAKENFGLTADVNYTSTYNKVKQELPGAMQMRDLKSDITAYALSTGLRAEYRLNTQYVDIIPHLGVRYMYVSTDSYDVKSNGTVMRGDEMNQNIWTFPIGVTFSKQVETGNGWYVKPNLDLGIIPATGDIEAKSKIRFTGTGTKAELDTHTMDYMSYTGGLGLDFGNDNLSLGVNYNIQASEHSTSHGVFGTVRYEF